MNERSCKGARRGAVARRAMVATSQPLAVQVGIDVLKAGGHAVDAAIAVNAMLGLVEPMSCGLGGDVFAIVWDAAAKSLYGLNGSGRSPRRMTRSAFAARKLERIPLYGPLTWTVPGCVDGWFALHGRFGRISMADLLAPAVRHAKDGFELTPVIARMWSQAADRLNADPGARNTFLFDGRPPAAGDRVSNPELASSLQAIIDSGPEAFYQGPIADGIVRCAKERGGFMTHDDLAAHRTTWVEPVSCSYRGFDVWELPPSTQGIAALETLAILDGFTLRPLGHNTVATIHRSIEAKKLAYEDRARFYADPEFAPVPLAKLLSPEHAAKQRECIDLQRAATSIPPDLFPRSDTVYLTVVDEQRNAVSFIQSIYHGFGSGIVPPGLGFAMQNRGNLFHLDPHHPNTLEPGKRPFHTIIPAMVTQDGRPVFSFGVMGGDMQPQGHVQILINLLDFGMDPQAAGEALRWRHDGSSTPVGDVMVDGGTVYLEPGFPPAIVAGLQALGHRVEIRDGGYGGYQGIRIDWDTGELVGGSEPRKDGCAIGY